MALALVFVELIDIDEDAGLLHSSKLMVDGGAKDEHRGREVHVGIDKRGNVAAAVAHLGIEDAVVELEVGLYEELAELRGVVLEEQGLIGAHHVAAVAKVLVEEVEDHVARHAVIRGVHGHLTKEVLGIGEHHGEGGKAIEEVVEGKETLGAGTRRLVLDSDERATQLEGIGEVVVDELLGEMEHVRGGEDGLTLVVELHIGTVDVAVAANDLFGLGVPHDKLLVGDVHGVELIDIDTHACATASGAECLFAQAAYLLHHVGCVVGIDNIEVVASAVGVTKASVFGELGLEQVLADGFNDVLHCRKCVIRTIFYRILCKFNGFFLFLHIF